MRRLNVRLAQLKTCVENSIFAISSCPRSRELEAGEWLLLQLVMAEARATGHSHRRIEHAIVFDYLEEDRDGTLSRRYWPAENRTWRWIVRGSETIDVLPFSIEDLPLEDPRKYMGQTNPQYISPEDEEIIRRHLGVR